MTALLPETFAFDIGAIVRLKDCYGGSKPAEVINRGPCSEWATQYPYVHQCAGCVTLFIDDGDKCMKVHEDMVEKAE